MIDTHCHLQSSRFDIDRPQVLARAWAAGLKGMVVPAIHPDDWVGLQALHNKDSRLQIALGVHPQVLPSLTTAEDDNLLARLDGYLAQRKAVAVGECGLDASSSKEAPLERQLQILKGHFALARKHRLPVLVHCLRAHAALVTFLQNEPFPEAGVLLHSYSGGAELASFYVERGCSFAFAGPITFERARKPIEALKAIPADRLMAETDAPDQSPTPYRGKRCEPAYLQLVIAAMARAIGVTIGDMERLATENTERFFKVHFT